jgi:hypothetical protein
LYLAQVPAAAVPLAAAVVVEVEEPAAVVEPGPDLPPQVEAPEAEFRHRKSQKMQLRLLKPEK